MNKQNAASAKWQIYIKELFVSQTSGQFSTSDLTELPVVLEWEMIDPKSPRLTEKISALSHLLVPAYSNIEIAFAQQYPEEIANDMFLKSLEPLLNNGLNHIDWQLAKEKIVNTLNHFFTQMNWSNYTKECDVHLFIVAMDKKTKEQLGMIQFILSPEYDYGTVKVELYDGVMPNILNRDIEKILLSSIYKLIPNIKRIFFHTRINNLNGVKAHQALGFSKLSGDLPNWIDLEYKSEQSEILQKFSHTFI